jgi:DNA repair exonuclease SbcCD ATPase subunit
MKWSNMFSYGDNNEIDFTKNRLTQVVGKNGHGKSSIPYILEELLWSKNSKGYKKSAIVNRYSNGNKYSGSIEFNVDGHEYVLNVARSGATQKVTLLKDGEDISQHTATNTYAILEKLLGREFKVFSQLVYQNNASSLQFLTATDTNRKKFLIDLLNLERYLEIHETAKGIYKDINDSLMQSQGELSVVEKWLKSNGGADLQKRELLELPRASDPDQEQELKRLNALLHNIDKENAEIEKNNSYKQQRNRIPMEVLTVSGEEIDTKTFLREEAEAKQAQRIEGDLIKKIQHLAGSCPTCLQSIDKEFIERLLREANERLDASKQVASRCAGQIKEANEKNQKLKSAREQISNFERLSSLINTSLPEECHDINELKTQIKTLERSIDSISKEYNRVVVLNREIENRNSQIDLIQSQIDDFNTKLATIKKEITEKTDLLANLEILKKAFSTNGLIAYKIENSVKDLETLTNEYLADLSDGRFQLFFVVSNDKLNVIIKDNGIDIEVVSLSAGELARVTTATLLAIRKLMASLSKSKINLLFLDETIDVLDDEGKERLIDILIKEEDLNIFLVSHGYSHPLLEKLSVVKTNNISRIIAD